MAHKFDRDITLRDVSDVDGLRRRFWSKVDTTGDCWIWLAATARHGYGSIHIMVCGQLYILAAHRVAYLLANGTLGAASVMCHRCDQPRCVRPAHLWQGTQKDNARDRDAKGRCHPLRNVGECNGSAKLTPSLVRDIRARHAAGETYYRLAKEYGVDIKTMYRVVRGLTWKEV